MEKVLEKNTLKYVVAGIDSNYCWYVASKHYPVEGRLVGKTEYYTTTDIELAAKASKKEIAEVIRDDYLRLSGDANLELVVVPLVTEYYLVKEIEA